MPYKVLQAFDGNTFVVHRRHKRMPEYVRRNSWELHSMACIALIQDSLQCAIKLHMVHELYHIRRIISN